MGTEDIYLRNIRANISYDQDNTEVDISESVINAKVDEIACSGNVLKMGEFCKNSIEFEYNPSLLENPSIFWNNKKLNVSLQYEYIYPSESTFPSSERYMYKTISLGKFYVNADDVETSNNGSTYVVTAYDLPKKMSDIYDTESSPTDSIEILHKIESDTGMVFANIDIISSFKIESVPEGTTYAGMVAYIAGYEGYNARVNSSGEIEFYWYFDANIDTSKLYTIKREVQYLNGFSIKETLASINAVMSGKADTESENGSSKYTAGSGEALTYDNPYITQEKVTEIYNRIKGFTYCIGDLKWRADQNIRAGDLVRVETKPGEYVLFPVMEYSMTLDGGLVGNSISYTYVVQNNVMGSTPSDKKLSNVYKNLTEAFKKQTGIIKMNEKAGFYRLLIDDETGFPYGWVIADSEEITETTKGWMWTQGGLMHSSDGFRTADKIAFTQDGQLSAEMISANSITLGNLNVDALNKIEGAYDHADSGDANTLKSANSYADTSAQNAVNAQTQDDIFNKLTNNGTVKGIILTDGKLYINADYITSGILNATLLRAGIIKSAKNDGNYWNLDTGEFAITGYATDQELSSGVSDTKSYASTQATNALNSAKSYSDTGDSNTLTSANETAQEKANAAESNAKTYSDNKVSEFNNLLTQTEIFNRLTNNGQAQGIYLQNGKIYINLEYLVSNIIKGLNIFGSTITFGDQDDTYRVQASYKESSTSYEGYVPRGVTFETFDSGASVQHITDKFLVTSYTNRSHNMLFLQEGTFSQLRSKKPDGSSEAWVSASTVHDDPGVLLSVEKGTDILNTLYVGTDEIYLAVDYLKNILSFKSGGKLALLGKYNSEQYSITSIDGNGNIVYKTQRNNFLQACDGSGNVKAYLQMYSNGQAWLSSDGQMVLISKGNSWLKSLGNNVYIQSRDSSDNSTNAYVYVQADGYVQIGSSGNAKALINGYPAVRINGTYHDIFFQWNGASLIATVDVTQVWSTSDRRLKDQIDTISDDYIDAIGSAEIKQFIFTDKIYDKSIKHFGVIAQDLREALESKGINPEEIAVNNHFDRDGEEYYGIDKEEFLMARIAYDEKKIKMLEERIEKLEKLILKES